MRVSKAAAIIIVFIILLAMFFLDPVKLVLHKTGIANEYYYLKVPENFDGFASKVTIKTAKPELNKYLIEKRLEGSLKHYSLKTFLTLFLYGLIPFEKFYAKYHVTGYDDVYFISPNSFEYYNNSSYLNGEGDYKTIYNDSDKAFKYAISAMSVMGVRPKNFNVHIHKLAVIREDGVTYGQYLNSYPGYPGIADKRFDLADITQYSLIFVPAINGIPVYRKDNDNDYHVSNISVMRINEYDILSMDYNWLEIEATDDSFIKDNKVNDSEDWSGKTVLENLKHDFPDRYIFPLFITDDYVELNKYYGILDYYRYDIEYIVDAETGEIVKKYSH